MTPGSDYEPGATPIELFVVYVMFCVSNNPNFPGTFNVKPCPSWHSVTLSMMPVEALVPDSCGIYVVSGYQACPHLSSLTVDFH
jgi:hypothetical protein